MESAVYFANARARMDKESKVNKIRKLFDAAGFSEIIRKGDLTAIKLHFGELGNDSYVSPVLVRQIVDKVKTLGAKPFLTDTNTLYGGSRANSVDHIMTAIQHGFDYAVVDAPLIIADGLNSDYYEGIEINKKQFKSVKIAGEIAAADSMIVVSHFKAHLPAGFGGAVKNLGMGCAPASGKSEQHSAKPIINQELCIGCKICMENCPASALTVNEKISGVDYDACQGCGKCLRVCPTHAIDFNWFVELPPFMERLTEYALGAVKGKEGRIGYFNLLLNITPDCDCVPWSDHPFVPDIGILASSDPVAIDYACYDLVNDQTGLKNSLLQRNHEPGKDKFKGVWENTEGLIQIDYGAQIGLGNKDYRLIEV